MHYKDSLCLDQRYEICCKMSYCSPRFSSVIVFVYKTVDAHKLPDFISDDTCNLTIFNNSLQDLLNVR